MTEQRAPYNNLPWGITINGNPDSGPKSDDAEMLIDMVRGLGTLDNVSVCTIYGEPRSKSRYRQGKHGNSYNPSSGEEQRIGWELKQRFKSPVSNNVAVMCVFYRSNRQRIDVDNMLKLVMDAATGICFYDDDQVTAQVGILELDAKAPRTIIAIGEHTSTMDRSYRSKICETCGKAFRPSLPDGKFCSRACASRSRGADLSESKACPVCGISFRRRTRSQIYCSEQCRKAQMAKRNSAKKKHATAYCIDCGNKLSKPGYVRCRPCWLERMRSRRVS